MPNRYLTLDAIRGTAAIAVLMLHGSGWFGALRPAAGYLAVDLFFALSGFIIARIYTPRFASGMSVPDFAWQRLKRFWPLYMVGTLLGLLVYSIATPSPQRLAEFAGALLFLPTGDAHLYPLNRVAWSLGLELLINIAFALVWRHLTYARLIAIVAASAVALAFVAFRDGNLEGGYSLATADVGLVRCLFSFSLGVLLHRLEPGLRLPALPAWLIVVAPLPLVFRTFGPAYELTLVMLIFPALLLLGSRTEPASGKQFAAALGMLSYALYAVHKPLISLIDNGAEDAFGIDLSSYAPASGVLIAAPIVIGAWLLARGDEALRNRWRDDRQAMRIQPAE